MRLKIGSARRASSEAIFGSTARGDSDRLSDCDVLIVDDDVRILNERSRDLEARGASVASYTFNKLLFLANNGALFIQHLKLESQIETDRHDKLATILSNFTPKASYAADIAENSQLAALAGIVPNCRRGYLLASDILYVSVRNYGVLSLAERGIHTYAFDTVIKHLESEGLIAKGGARALSSLRFLKCLYRKGESENGNNVKEAVSAALGVLPSKFFPKNVTPIEPFKFLCTPRPQSNAAYVVLRDLERRMVALHSLGFVAARNPKLMNFERWVTNPRAYASISQRLSDETHELIMEAGELLSSARSSKIVQSR